MTTGGEGGLVTTNDQRLWEIAWSFKDHGKSYEAVHHRQHPPGFRWLHESFGTNWRMTEMQAALGRVILQKLPQWVALRRKYAARLSECFRSLPGLRVTRPASEIQHSYYKYYAFVRPERLRQGWDRDRIMAEIAAAGVTCLSGSCSEIYLEGAFPAELRPSERLPIARELGETSLMFLVHPTLSDAHIEQTCDAVQRVMQLATA